MVAALGAGLAAVGVLWSALYGLGLVVWLFGAYALAQHYRDARLVEYSVYAAAAAVAGVIVVKVVGAAGLLAARSAFWSLLKSYIAMWPFAAATGLFLSKALDSIAAGAGVEGGLRLASRLVFYGGGTYGLIVGAALMAVGLLVALTALLSLEAPGGRAGQAGQGAAGGGAPGP